MCGCCQLLAGLRWAAGNGERIAVPYDGSIAKDRARLGDLVIGLPVHRLRRSGRARGGCRGVLRGLASVRDRRLGAACQADPGKSGRVAARDCDLFPKCARGALDLAAFRPEGMFPFPVLGASQVKLVRDGEGAWYLLGFRSDPDDDPNGTDFADVYGVRFNPFAITPLLFSVHVILKPGDTWLRQHRNAPCGVVGAPAAQFVLPVGQGRGTRRLQLRLTGRRVPFVVTGPVRPRCSRPS